MPVRLRAGLAPDLGFLSELAREAFEQVRRELGGRKLPFDYALASLELAGLHLERGRTAEVRAIYTTVMGAPSRRPATPRVA